MMRIPILFAVILLLGACVKPSMDDPDSVFYSIKPGSTLQLQRELHVLPGQVSVWFQHGNVVAEPLLDRYQPYCKFEIRTMAEYARQLEADTFIIRRAVDEIENTTSLSGMRLASQLMVADGPSVYTYVTHLYLYSPQQPDVLRLSCMHWEDVQDDNFLTVAQMREALGEWLSLELKP